MDLQAPAPSSASDDGMYRLEELPEPVKPAEAPTELFTRNDDTTVIAPLPIGLSDTAPATGKPKKNGKPGKAEARTESKGGFSLATFWRRATAKTQESPAPATNGETTPDAPAAAARPVDKATARKRRRRRRALRLALPAWSVSFVIHMTILIALAAATFSEPVRKAMNSIDSALVSNPGGADELVKIWAEPTNQPRDQAVGNDGGPSAPAASSSGGGGGGGTFGGIGTGPPSNTPVVAGGGGNINEKNGLPGIKVVAQVSGLGLATLAAPTMDLGGAGMVAGDVTFGTKDIGEALDQLAREILRHLTRHKLTVVWLFDESESMKDDQKAIRQKFDRVASELKINVDGAAKKKDAAALNHAIVGFGESMDYILGKPTLNIDVIGQAIDKLKIDETGTENTMQAIDNVIKNYSNLISKDRRLLIVLVTDESGDDGAHIEELHQLAVSQKVPIYVIGRQSLFGYDRAHLQYVDPVTKDVYWPAIRRGPETADIELLQWDGLHDRWDEQPSGFAPYELARLAKDTGGIYFLLPSEENMRVRQREKAYSIKDLKEYVPAYESRAAYVAARNKSEFRRTLYEIIQLTRPKDGDPGFTFRRHFPIDPQELLPACQEAMANAKDKLARLLQIQARLDSPQFQRLRDRETEKRWQAHYDLMLAQIVTYQIKAYEYGSCLEEMMKKPPRPTKMPSQDLVVEWVIDHSHDRKAPKDRTDKKYVEAERLLKLVMERHPKTPWADLAQDELARGFGAQRNEWHHNPRYDERAKLVPKY